jgi:hypothetical protein
MNTAAILAAVLITYSVAGLPQTAQADEWLDRYQQQKEEQRLQDTSERIDYEKRERQMQQYQQRHRENAREQFFREGLEHYRRRVN